MFWRRQSRSQPLGRPRIAQEHITFIRRISSDHPEWGEDKIAEEFAARFAIHHSASTIRRYMVPRDRTPRGDQTWRAFIRNHFRDVWAWLRGLAADKLMGRRPGSPTSRMLGIVIDLVLVLLGVWLLAWIVRQILGLVVGH